MSKRIKITILQVPQVGDIVRFTMPTTAPKSQTFVTLRSGSGKATIGQTAVQSAANLYAAYVADFGGITEMDFSYAPGTNYIYLDNTFTAGQINTRLYDLYSSNTANIEIRTIGMESYPAKITAATLPTSLIPTNSPIHIFASGLAGQETHSKINLWIWNGTYNSQNLLDPSVVLFKKNYDGIPNQVGESPATNALYEVSEYIKSFIKNGLDMNPITGTLSTANYVNAVYYKYEELGYIIGDNPSTVPDDSKSTYIKSSPLYIAHSGYQFDYESTLYTNQEMLSYGFPVTYNNAFLAKRNYVTDLKYFTGQYVYPSAISSPTPQDYISYLPFVPVNTQCVKEKMYIKFINKSGLYELFTPVGKITVNNTIQRDSYERTYYNVSMFHTNKQHLVSQYNINSKQNWSVNTGNITEESSQKVEELLYSPEVKLFTFDKNNNYVEYPVVVSDTNFTRKTKINDKAVINYIIIFQSVIGSKIKNVR